MNIGERVISLVDIVDSVQMFPAKYETPKTTSVSSGSRAIIEEIYSSGWGIVKFDNGKKVLVSDLKNKFVVS